MNDKELRRLVLQKHYDRRDDTDNDTALSSEDFDNMIPDNVIFRISEHLSQYGYIECNFVADLALCCITAAGVDVIEGSRKPEIAIELKIPPSQVNYISESQNVNVGNNNTIRQITNFHEINEILRKIDESDAPEEEKNGARKQFFDFLKHPVFVELYKGAIEAMLKTYNMS